MRDLRHSKVMTVLLLVLIGSGCLLLGTSDVRAENREGLEVQIRGPVHEAFAEFTSPDPEVGMVVPKAPPADIEEIPPEEKPEGDNYAWIPGYWGWDEDRNDFLWISGIWRDPPPDSNWTPGYWTQGNGGSQWVSGFWLPNEVEEASYLPPPPPSLEEGPQSDPPSQDQIWVPGSWVWPDDHYVWQPGNWVEARPDWVYTPTHYNWTPRGYVHVKGYWDYPIANRGVLFAPVYFNQPVYTQSGFRYSPNVLIDAGGLTNNLFRYPRYSHYVFGDYYGDESTQRGIVPWFQATSGDRGYDPLYSHQRWERNRHDSKWSDQMQADYQLRRDKADARPPRIFVDSQASAVAHPEENQNNIIYARTLQQVATEKNPSLKLIKIDQGERDNLGKRGRDLREFTQVRVKREAVPVQQPLVTPPEGQAVQIEKLAIPKSPIKSVVTAVKDDPKAPPALPQIPKPDPNAQPRPRKDKGDEVRKPLEKAKEPPSVQTETAPLLLQPEGAKGKEKDGTPGQPAVKKAPEGPPPGTTPNVSETLPRVKPDRKIKEQEKDKVAPVEKKDPKGKGQNLEIPKDKVLRDRGARHNRLPVMKPKAEEVAPKAEGTGTQPKNPTSSHVEEQKNVTTWKPKTNTGRVSPIDNKGQGNLDGVKSNPDTSKGVPNINRDKQSQPPSNTGVNRNQGVNKTKPKVTRRAQPQAPQAPPVVTAPPPVSNAPAVEAPPQAPQVQTQDDPKNKGKGKGKGKK